MTSRRRTRPDARWRVAHALSMWREGEALILRPVNAARRTAYDQAVGMMVHSLRDRSTMGELLETYFDDRAAVVALVERASASADEDPQHPLVRATVEDAAFWRRLRELLAARGQPD